MDPDLKRKLYEFSDDLHHWEEKHPNEDMPTWVDRAWERITRGLIEDEDEEPNGSTTKR